MFGQTTLNFGQTATQQQNTNPNNDYIVPSSPNDTITSVRFDNTNQYLCGTSWNKDLCVWQIAQQQTQQQQPQGGFGTTNTATTNVSTSIQAQPKAKTTHTHPILCSAWSPDSTCIMYGGCDNTVKLWNLNTQQTSSIGQHGSAIKDIFWSTQLNMCITGSWDKTIKYWDLRSSNNQAVATLDVKERVYAMDIKGGLCVVATADRQLHIINLAQPQTIYKSHESPLKYQTRCVSCFSDMSGFCVGGVEGRVGVVNINETATKKNFQFKCHREGKDNNDVYSVNSIAFNDSQGTFSTAGSDGTYVYWDKDAKSRLKQFNKHPNAITCSTFSPNSTMFAYAIGYDWSRGHTEYSNHKLPCEIHIHPVQPTEIKKK